MNYIPYALTALGVLVVVFFCMARDRNGSVEALLLKTTASFLFMSVAFSSFIANDKAPLYFALIIMGLSCGLIGDIVLDLKIIYKESSSLYQSAGMTAFFVGHIFYIGALIIFGGNFHWMPLAAAAALGVGTSLLSQFVLKFKFKEHTVHIYAYAVALFYMAAQSCWITYQTGFSVSFLFMGLGGVLFLLSDLVLLMTYYDNRDSKLFISTNHILYYGAQFLIALSVLFITVY